MADRNDDLGRFRAACSARPPRVLLVFGSGLGEVAERIATEARLPFAAVPGLPPSGVAGHRGEMLLGTLAGQRVLASVGRVHYYEGHPWSSVVRPVTFAVELGASLAILTNAAGGIRDDLTPGTLMPIGDHLEWNRPAPWRSPIEPSPYDGELLAGLTDLPAGVYASVCGPSYETPAEIRALRSAGADAVGMSTSREALAARAAGMRVAALSFVTNRAAGLGANTLSHAEVLHAARSAGALVGDTIEAALARLR